MKKLTTPAEGAAEERRLWIRKVKALLKENPKNAALALLLEYGEGRVKRNKKELGGL